MPQNVWCDAKDCIFYDEEWGECDVYRLKIEGGVCVGHPRSGRNVTSNDAVEKLKAENAKLRELVRGLKFCSENIGCDYCDDDDDRHICPLKDPDGGERCDAMMRELGIEADE